MVINVPLDDDDVARLNHLALTWDLTPQQALRKALDQALIQAEYDAPGSGLREMIDEALASRRVGHERRRSSRRPDSTN